MVFTPKRLQALLSVHSLPATLGRDWTFTAKGPEEVAALLEAPLGDSVDFYFTPTPKRYYLFADHDEYAVIYGATKGHVGRVATALVQAGFSRVEGYVRRR